MKILENIKEKIMDFLDNSSQITKTLMLILVIFLLSSIIILCISFPKIKSKKTKLPEEIIYTQGHEVFNPEDIKLVEEYYFSRDIKENWDEEELEKWFVEPDNEAINNLSESNEKIINEILGVCP